MPITITIRCVAVIILVISLVSCAGKQVLRSEIADVNIAKTTSIPPVNTCNKPCGLSIVSDGVGGWKLTWRYRNHGDYNRDGLVDISDITQVAMCFGQSNSAIGEDGAGAVGVGDITPIAQHFMSEVNGYVVETSSGAGGPYSELTRLGFTELSLSDGLLVGSITLAELDNCYYRVIPYDGNDTLGQPSDPYSRSFAAPVINGVMPVTALANQSVNMLASVTGEGLISYSWTFGTGALPVSSAEKSPSVIFTQAGPIQCSLAATTVFGSDTLDFTVAVTNPGAGPYITAVYPQSGLAGVPLAFGADAGGEEPLAYSWTFDGGEPAVSSERTPTVTFADAGAHDVSLTVANSIDSAVYNYSFSAIAGLDIELLAVRIVIDGATNTLDGSFYLGTSKFDKPLTGKGQGLASVNGALHGYLDSISYLYPPGGDPFGFDDAPPVGHAGEYAATLDYLSTMLEWDISLAGYTEAELFTHDPGELPGQLLGNLGGIADIYAVTAQIPAGVLGIPQPIGVVIDLSVSNP